MVSPAPGLYVGTIRHRRFTPRRHEFTYGLFMALLDIDRLREAMSVSAFTSYNRPNWATFDDRDHLGDPSRPLRERLRESAAASGHTLPEGPIYLLTHLRYAGYAFNPISIYYCHDEAHVLRSVVADVSNTYEGRRQYWLRPSDDDRRRFRAVAAKTLDVSPFMESRAGYEFVLTPPGRRLIAHMNVTADPAWRDDSGRLFDATLTLERRPWTAPAIRSALARFPWMTAKVITAIYWEAFRLRLKGLPVISSPETSR